MLHPESESAQNHDLQRHNDFEHLIYSRLQCTRRQQAIELQILRAVYNKAKT